MRRTLPDQLPLVPAFHAHVRSRELEAMSQILDAHPEAARWVLGDLGGFSYDELAVHLADSTSYRAFCRIGIRSRRRRGSNAT